MKTLVLKLILAISLLIPALANAGYYRIVNIQEYNRKIYTTEPRQICDRLYNHNRIGNAIIGGVIGNQFGRGNGRRAATIGGTIIGYNYNPRSYNCRTEYIRTVKYITYGYIVYYDYYGSLKSTYMTEYPNSYDIFVPYWSIK